VIPGTQRAKSNERIGPRRGSGNTRRQICHRRCSSRRGDRCRNLRTLRCVRNRLRWALEYADDIDPHTALRDEIDRRQLFLQFGANYSCRAGADGWSATATTGRSGEFG